MATDGRWLAVGAKFVDTLSGEDSGAVYVYRKQADGQWAFVQKLVPLLLFSSYIPKGLNRTKSTRARQ